MARSIAIIDSGGANIASLLFALQRLGYDASLTTDVDVIGSADRVVLPGVGAAAGLGMRCASSYRMGVKNSVKNVVSDKPPMMVMASGRCSCSPLPRPMTVT